MTYHGSRFSHNFHSSCNILRKKNSHSPTFVLPQLCILTYNEKKKRIQITSHKCFTQMKDTKLISTHSNLPSLWFSPTPFILSHHPYLHCHILNAKIIIFVSKNNKPKKESHKCACNILKKYLTQHRPTIVNILHECKDTQLKNHYHY